MRVVVMEETVRRGWERRGRKGSRRRGRRKEGKEEVERGKEEDRRRIWTMEEGRERESEREGWRK